MQGWHLLSRNLHQVCLSSSSDGQIKQVLAVPHHQLRISKLFKSLVTSILLSGRKTFTLLVDSEKKIQAFETKCQRKLLHISSLEHKTNNWLWSKIYSCIGPWEPLLATIKEMETRMVWTCHMPRQPLQNHPPPTPHPKLVKGQN